MGLWIACPLCVPLLVRADYSYGVSLWYGSACSSGASEAVALLQETSPFSLPVVFLLSVFVTELGLFHSSQCRSLGRAICDL